MKLFKFNLVKWQYMRCVQISAELLLNTPIYYVWRPIYSERITGVWKVSIRSNLWLSFCAYAS